MSIGISPFPDLTPVPRAGDPRCAAHPVATDPACGAPATWHIAWVLAQPAQFSLVCDEHMGWVQQVFVYADRHPAAVNCDMPGTGWLAAVPSQCVPAPTADPATT